MKRWTVLAAAAAALTMLAAGAAPASAMGSGNPYQDMQVGVTGAGTVKRKSKTGIVSRSTRTRRDWEITDTLTGADYKKLPPEVVTQWLEEDEDD